MVAFQFKWISPFSRSADIYRILRHPSSVTENKSVSSAIALALAKAIAASFSFDEADRDRSFLIRSRFMAEILADLPRVVKKNLTDSCVF